MAPSKGTGPLYEVKKNSTHKFWTINSLQNRKILFPQDNASKLLVRADGGPSIISGKINHTAAVIYITHLTCIIFVIHLLQQKKEKFLILTHNT
jgi:hypothetical protein